jgi:hypothetical protein
MTLAELSAELSSLKAQLVAANKQQRRRIQELIDHVEREIRRLVPSPNQAG